MLFLKNCCETWHILKHYIKLYIIYSAVQDYIFYIEVDLWNLNFVSNKIYLNYSTFSIRSLYPVKPCCLQGIDTKRIGETLQINRKVFSLVRCSTDLAIKWAKVVCKKLRLPIDSFAKWVGRCMCVCVLVLVFISAVITPAGHWKRSAAFYLAEVFKLSADFTENLHGYISVPLFPFPSL